MPITRTPIIDDDGSGTTGTVIDDAWKQELYGQIDAFAGPLLAGRISLVPAGTVNDWDPPGGAAVRLWTLVPTAPCTIAGIKVAAAGTEHILSNESIHAITIGHALTSSGIGTRFICPGGVAIVLAVYESITVMYSQSLAHWQVLGLKRT